MSNLQISKSAFISECGKYRFRLARYWDARLPQITFIMLNPSTADSERDDPTIRRLIAYAQKWGYGGFEVVNLYALRATDPKELLSSSEPTGGMENVYWIKNSIENASKVVCAWGNWPTVEKLLKKFPDYRPLEGIPVDSFYYLELSKDGVPKHPLYLKSDLEPKQFTFPKQRLP